MDDVASIVDEAPTLRKLNTGVAAAPFTFTLSQGPPENVQNITRWHFNFELSVGGIVQVTFRAVIGREDDCSQSIPCTASFLVCIDQHQLAYETANLTVYASRILRRS